MASLESIQAKIAKLQSQAESISKSSQFELPWDRGGWLVQVDADTAMVLLNCR